MQGTARIVAIKAICDYRAPSPANQNPYVLSFSIDESLELSDGRIVELIGNRGFTLGSNSREGWVSTTEEDIIEHARLTMMSDGEPTEMIDWDRISEAALKRGVAIAPSELRKIPYRFELSPAMKEFLKQFQ